ncbi:MAG TPA: CRISPR-associated endonuclease Cas2 [Firmicutes bacterium]|nr:CRISPR-associated endonuclease Cas2 [Bacillota bacterium]
MMVLITFDVDTKGAAGEKRLRNVAKACSDMGQRVQHSVFECLVDPAQFRDLKEKLGSVIDVNKDSLRFYFLGSNWKNRVECIGVNEAYDPEGVLIT